MMSLSSWNALLHQHLNSPLPHRPDVALRLAIVGVGNDLHGDDGAGTLVVRALTAHKPIATDRLCLIEGGLAPEAYTGVIRRFKPTHVLIIDCALMNAPPGTVDWLPWQQVDGISASTHTFPLSLFATYLTTALDCEVLVLGIQPDTTAFGASVSVAVHTAVQEVIVFLSEEIQNDFSE